MKKGLFWIGGIIVLVLFMSLNVLISIKNGDDILPSVNLSKISVEAQTGTCCPETGSYCIVGSHYHPDHYYKTSGSCAGDVEMAY